MMRRYVVAASTAAVVLCAGALLGMSGGADPEIQQPAEGSIEQEPVVVYEVAGYGIGGPIHERLTVYSNGLSSYSTAGSFAPSQACFFSAGADAARQLRRDLAAAGAFDINDLPLIGNDLPVITVTVFQPGQNGWSRAKTFSFMVDFGGGASGVVNIIESFIDTYVPPDCGSPDGSG